MKLVTPCLPETVKPVVPAEVFVAGQIRVAGPKSSGQEARPRSKKRRTASPQQRWWRFYEHAKVFIRAPKAHVEERMGGGREGETILWLVFFGCYGTHDVRGLHDSGLVGRYETIPGEGAGELVAADHFALNRALRPASRAARQAAWSSAKARFRTAEGAREAERRGKRDFFG